MTKRQFGFDRVRYRGLEKNENRMFACFALVNLYITRKRLAPLGASCVRRACKQGVADNVSRNCAAYIAVERSLRVWPRPAVKRRGLIRGSLTQTLTFI